MKRNLEHGTGNMESRCASVRGGANLEHTEENLGRSSVGKRYGRNAFGFEDLNVYQAARTFRNNIYDLTRQLPADEKYGLLRQMRRAAVSITNNMAEGYGRYTWQDTTHFFRQARGSLAELFDDLGICDDQGMAETARLDTLRTEAVQLLQLINGYIRYLQSKKGAAEKPQGH
ncbi:MAG: four helix bundle protein [Phycisphaerae bacterium]